MSGMVQGKGPTWEPGPQVPGLDTDVNCTLQGAQVLPKGLS